MQQDFTFLFFRGLMSILHENLRFYCSMKPLNETHQFFLIRGWDNMRQLLDVFLIFQNFGIQQHCTLDYARVCLKLNWDIPEYAESLVNTMDGMGSPKHSETKPNYIGYIQPYYLWKFVGYKYYDINIYTDIWLVWS